jgi:hypothetical protein
MGNDRGALMHELHGRYYEQAYRGKMFLATTAVTGVAPGTAAGTTAAFAFFNKYNSGVNCEIVGAWMGYVSGTLGAGVINWYRTGVAGEVVPTGTAITASNALIGGPAPVGGTPLTTATLANAPLLVRPFCSIGASLASTAVQPWQIYDDVEGGLIVPPGFSVSLQATAAAGASPLVIFGIAWLEVPQ